jgi:hypothetical protein
VPASLVVSLIGPDDQPIEINETTSDAGTVWQTATSATPGIHRWRISDQTIDLSAVNFPDSESDLRPLKESPKFGTRAISGDSLVRQAALARGVTLWPWLALVGLGFLVIESLVHTRNSPTAAT